MPIQNTTQVAPAAAIAPASSRSVGPEGTAIGAVFGDILNDQNQLLPSAEPAAPGIPGVGDGGNLLQAGGKNLPELPPISDPVLSQPVAPEPEFDAIVATVSGGATVTANAETGAAVSATAAVAASATVAQELSATARDDTVKLAGDVPLETPPVAGPLPASLLPPNTAPVIGSATYSSADVNTMGVVREAGRVAVTSVGEQTARGLVFKADERAPRGGVPSASAAIESSTAITRAALTASEPGIPGSYSDQIGQPRTTQAMAGIAESVASMTEPLAGREVSPTKYTAPGSTAIQGIVAPPITQTDSGVGVKATGSAAMTLAPGGPNWNSEFAARVSTVVKNGVQEASLQLSPPELGRLEVKVTTEGDQAKILFTVQNVAAKDAIEQAMPRLRDMLEQSGLQLAHSEVSDHSTPQRRDSDQPAVELSGTSGDATDDLLDAPVAEVAAVSPDALVDYYI